MSAVSSGPSVAVIGGGISGLVCANRLAQLGIHSTTVFDTGKHGPGGRCSSRQVMLEGRLYTFDHSAQYFTVSDSRFAKIVSFLHRRGAVKVWKGKVGHLRHGHFKHDPKLTQAFIGVNGMADIPKCLAASLNTKTGSWIGYVNWEESAKKWRVDKYGFFDYIVISHNGKCADKLMSNSGAGGIHKLTQVRFGDQLNARDKRMQLCSVWALLVAFPVSLKQQYDGAHVEDEDISWLANNTSKLANPGNPTPSSVECWTVFSTRQFGTRHKCPQENIPSKVEREVTAKLLEAMQRATGMVKLPAPIYTRVQLWGAAVPMNILQGDEECVFDAETQAGICGDWLVSPCIQGAAVSGLALAERIAKHAAGQPSTSTSMASDFRPAPGTCIGDFPTNPNMIFNPTV